MFSSKSDFKKEFQARLLERYGVDVANSCANEQYTILGEMVRDFANKDLFNTHNESTSKGKKTLKSVDRILLQWQARDDINKAGNTAIKDDWNKDIEKTMEIIKTKWLDE